MSKGSELRDAIRANKKLWKIDTCPRVPIDVAVAVYGRAKNDINPTKLLACSSKLEIATAIGFGGAQSETAVWHFQTEPVHHFVLVAWYDEIEREQSYSVFMAFEHPNPPVAGQLGYDFFDYVTNTMAHQLEINHKDKWSAFGLITMLNELLTQDVAWGKYFQRGVNKKVNSITYYKYDFIALDKAIANVNKY